MKIWAALDTRIETINKRTKIHTIQIQELEKTIKDLYKLKK
jgi:chaperonin cofactor prefoldin